MHCGVSLLSYSMGSIDSRCCQGMTHHSLSCATDAGHTGELNSASEV